MTASEVHFIDKDGEARHQVIITCVEERHDGALGRKTVVLKVRVGQPRFKTRLKLAWRSLFTNKPQVLAFSYRIEQERNLDAAGLQE
jgi:hypothetical protein